MSVFICELRHIKVVRVNINGTQVPHLTTQKEKADVKMYVHAGHTPPTLTHTKCTYYHHDVMVLGMYFQL